MLLKLQGHEVASCHAGAAALDAALNFLPDEVLVDLAMPHVDGFTVARRMRQEPKLEGCGSSRRQALELNASGQCEMR